MCRAFTDEDQCVLEAAIQRKITVAPRVDDLQTRQFQQWKRATVDRCVQQRADDVIGWQLGTDRIGRLGAVDRLALVTRGRSHRQHRQR